ncbi:hypothetical protein [Streptomyces sp. NPDC058466]|uniref:hypothetical protein n=1 Tax=Streptomyces sp. NPDC058466 TaxID=3346512 RepID=UPI0036566DE1
MEANTAALPSLAYFFDLFTLDDAAVAGLPAVPDSVVYDSTARELTGFLSGAYPSRRPGRLGDIGGACRDLLLAGNM